MNELAEKNEGIGTYVQNIRAREEKPYTETLANRTPKHLWYPAGLVGRAACYATLLKPMEKLESAFRRFPIYHL
ncbi:uncharacterized protein PHALS_03562 [Plasmopara halstedii]|uniref:Uncharacterized protein n=1 Tax=Plasmopara halstedii TaxID=4781 RepID=A0A0P1AZU6_PLAHL|nr:uncharacterized protein PHALS_03562 [Plasmopara halstedii]CEG46888.1 hypothetical protein PHALS_03562 [Plasmopara halstedii]|eukprot:XP_024583257.1 hypothetical protein PHALS_03562 [Plasmopara halstedii]